MSLVYTLRQDIKSKKGSWTGKKAGLYYHTLIRIQDRPITWKVITTVVEHLSHIQKKKTNYIPLINFIHKIQQKINDHHIAYIKTEINSSNYIYLIIDDQNCEKKTIRRLKKNSKPVRFRHVSYMTSANLIVVTVMVSMLMLMLMVMMMMSAAVELIFRRRWLLWLT